MTALLHAVERRARVTRVRPVPSGMKLLGLIVVEDGARARICRTAGSACRRWSGSPTGRSSSTCSTHCSSPASTRSWWRRRRALSNDIRECLGARARADGPPIRYLHQRGPARGHGRAADGGADRRRRAVRRSSRHRASSTSRSRRSSTRLWDAPDVALRRASGARPGRAPQRGHAGHAPPRRVQRRPRAGHGGSLVVRPGCAAARRPPRRGASAADVDLTTLGKRIAAAGGDVPGQARRQLAPVPRRPARSARAEPDRPRPARRRPAPTLEQRQPDRGPCLDPRGGVGSARA